MMQMKVWRVLNIPTRQFATKLKASTTDSVPAPAGKRRGVKKFGGEEAYEGDILVRQKGFKYKPGENTYIGRDQTIHASKEGKVVFVRDYWRSKKRWHIHVVQQEHPNRLLPNPPPFVYHPELFPELAKNNPEPYNLRVPEPKSAKLRRQRNPQKLGLRLAEKNEVEGNYIRLTQGTRPNGVIPRALKKPDFAFYTIQQHEDQQKEIEIDLPRRLEESGLIPESNAEILTDLKIY